MVGPASDDQDREQDRDQDRDQHREQNRELIPDLIRELHGLGVKLWVQEGRLRSRAPEGALTPALRARIQETKGEIVDYLQETPQQQAAIRPAPRELPLPLSFAQQRLWFLNQLEEGNGAAYNMPFVFRIQGRLEVAALEGSLREIVRRHESLRTVFHVDPPATDGDSDSPHQETQPQINADFRRLGRELIGENLRKSAVQFEGQVVTDGEADGGIDTGGVRQVIRDDAEFSLCVVDLRHSEEEREATIVRLAGEEARRPFDLSRDLMIRATLLQLAARRQTPEDPEYALLLTFHHIASDIWSVGIFLRELSTLYRARLQGAPAPLPPLPVQYADFALWQRQQLRGERLEEQLRYWRERLAGAPPLLELPTDRPRPPMQTFSGGLHGHALAAGLTEALKGLSLEAGATLFMTLAAAFQVLLMRYSQQEDLVIGTPIANRTRAAVEPLIGSFVNTLVLRTDLSGNPSFLELLQRVKGGALDAYRYQDLPFEALVEALQPERHLSYSPLFQVMFALQNVALEAPALPEVTLSLVEPEESTAKFDLQVSMIETAEGLRGVWIFNRDLFERETIERMAGHFENLLAEVVEHPRQEIHRLGLLSPGERRRMMVTWNDTTLPYPQGKSIHQCFEEQVARTPEAIAVTCHESLAGGTPAGGGAGSDGPRRLTYRQLNARADRLARHLRGLGAGDDAHPLVGLYLDRTVELLVGLLGILKAGAAYVPLDPSYPDERLAFMREDADLRLVVSQRSLRPRLPADLQVVCLDGDGQAPGDEAEERAQGRGDGHAPRRESAAHGLAYVIYTSGSTGKPKGVQITHRSVVNFLHAMQRQPGLGADDVMLAVTTLSFDISVLELFLPWTVGAQVLLAGRETASDGQRLLALLEESGATAMQATPATWRMLLACGWQGNDQLKILCGGEALPRPLAAQLLARGESLWNLYGPTEATIWSTLQQVREEPGAREESVPIGRPIGNTQVYILDPYRQQVPVGVAGELYIGGDGLAAGYLKRPELTAERFIANPFGAGRLYRTGDGCRYRPDGAIEYLGRLDGQVKVQGFRIELGEIEAVLGDAPAVRACAVAARAEGEEKRLVAYVVADDAERCRPGELRRFLQARLPGYMVPSAFVLLDELPLTPNGKVDRKALPAPDAANLGRETQYAPPRNPTEEGLATIWRDVLKIGRIGIHDSFFTLGGHSLLATQVVSRIRRQFGVQLPLRRLFTHPTIAALAAVVEPARRETQTVIGRVDRGQPLPLSFAQQRLWFLHQLEGATATYNMPTATRLTGKLDADALNWSLNEVVRRHESLRTRFVAVDGDVHQVIDEGSPFELPVTDLERLGDEEQTREVARLAALEADTPFDLSRDRMIRARLLRLAPAASVLLLTTHHIASDGWSVGVLVRELSALYRARVAGQPPALPALPVQYADFAHWQRQWLQGEVLERQLRYWKEQLRGVPALLELPTDRPRPAIQTFNGRHHAQALPDALITGLRALSVGCDTTLFIVLLAAFKVLMLRYSGQTDVVVGTTIANRTRVEIEPLIGFFVNTLALRSDLGGNPAFRTLLEQVKRVALEAYGHQDLPFEMLVEALHPERNLGHTPFFQVLFTMQNAPMESIELDELRLTPLPVETHTAKFDLIISASETANGWVAQWEYNSDLFEGATIERMADHYRTLLGAIVAAPEQPIQGLPLMDEAERHRLLVAWNRTGTAYPKEQCIHQLFEAQAARTPEAIAVTDFPSFMGEPTDDSPQRRLTFRQLNRRANRLAHRLRALGVGADDFVGICAERSPELLVGILGILKAGGAYLPLDPAYPRERLAFMLRDAGVSILLTQQRLADTVAPAPSGTVIQLDRDWEEIAAYPDDDPLNRTRPADLAYMIYTSGSTGTPKGTMIPHRGLVNYLSWCIEAYDVTAGEGAPVHSSIGFDATITSLFSPLLSGRQVVLLSERGELEELGALLCSGGPERRFSLVKITPAHLELLSRLVADPERINANAFIIGGEALYAKQVGFYRRHAPRSRLVNEYGPTETVVGCCVYQVPSCESMPELPDQAVPIGRPIANTQLYVLDEELQPVPIGVTGELYIGGDGVARGYHNRPELTAARFVDNPFGAGRLYRTGDRVRHLADGNLVFLGRIDHQVKVRGYRIELGEIEAVLAAHGTIREAAVVVREDAPDDKQLVAYLTLAPVRQSLQREHVADWQQLYAQTYGGLEPAGEAAGEPSFNLAGWSSSFTGEAIPEVEMAEWVDHTVAEILALQAAEVYEIGCGTGLLLSRLAPHCRRYVGADFSPQALAYIERLKADRQALASVSLCRRTADDFAGLEENTFDLVIINSVAQYFPSLEYLQQVLAGAVRIVRPNGHIYLGDVRNFSLLDAYHAAVQRFQAPAEWSREQLARQIQRQLLNEEELLIDPAFFRALPQQLPEVAGVRVALQRGRHHNELTCFRYQVTLRLAGDEETPAAREAPVPDWDWRQSGLTLPRLQQQLQEQQPPRVWVRGIPNARLQTAVETMGWLADDHNEKVALLRQREGARDGVEPDALIALGQELPYAVHLTWSEQDPEQGTIDALLCRHDPAGPRSAEWTVAPPRPSSSWQRHANNPMLRTLARSLAPEWREFLRQRLPDHMIPSAFVAMESLPLTANGKVDRRALPEPEREVVRQTGYLFPRTLKERQLVQIWEEVLGVYPLGVHDNFFDSGGHSLLAVRLMARIGQRFQQNLPLSILFQYPTVAALAEFLEQPTTEPLWSSLVAIQAHGGKPPFFCVPGAGGNVTYLYWLARHLGADQPFYGLQAVGLDGTTPPHPSVEAAAAHYVAEIQRVQPHGPYHLGAHSYGGKIAFEITQQLLRKGESIGTLALFDAGPPGEGRQKYRELDDVEFMLSLVDTVGKLMDYQHPLTREALAPLTHQERLLRVKEVLEAMGILPPDTDPVQVRGLIDVFRINEQIEYHPRETIPVPIDFFAAREQEASKLQWFLDGWSRLGPVEVHDVPGTHVTLLAEPHVQVLAEKLSRCLGRAANRGEHAPSGGLAATGTDA
ncbi:amino acid adenylation domain-containing protein [Endothiovibrio diazotrophicus]